MKDLQAISDKYCLVNHNDNNYFIGGGLHGEKFASRRHEDARNDSGKLTLGQATQLFKKATKMDIDPVREVIKFAIPNMEWHHAGKLPKSYGGGMKKTYFLNAQQICDLAKNWDIYVEKLRLSKIADLNSANERRNLEDRRFAFLQANAKRVERTTKPPLFFYKTAQEMNGKHGWFDSTYKSYKLPEYFSGWEFSEEAKYHEFLTIK